MTRKQRLEETDVRYAQRGRPYTIDELELRRRAQRVRRRNRRVDAAVILVTALLLAWLLLGWLTVPPATAAGPTPPPPESFPEAHPGYTMTVVNERPANNAMLDELVTMAREWWARRLGPEVLERPFPGIRLADDVTACYDAPAEPGGRHCFTVGGAGSYEGNYMVLNVVMVQAVQGADAQWWPGESGAPRIHLCGNVFHELGHVLNVPHQPHGLMSYDGLPSSVPFECRQWWRAYDDLRRAGYARRKRAERRAARRARAAHRARARARARAAR